jgi:dUTP pyrophosphatase
MGGPVTVRIVKKNPKARIPRYESAGAAGADVRACLEEPVIMAPMQRVRISTGLVLEIPRGYEAQIRPRSGLASRAGLTVLNSPGTIDSDYRGELEIILVNLGSGPFTVNDGDRIAQIVIAPAVQAAMTEAAFVSDTDRGSGGFGSTGI